MNKPCFTIGSFLIVMFSIEPVNNELSISQHSAKELNKSIIKLYIYLFHIQEQLLIIKKIKIK